MAAQTALGNAKNASMGRTHHLVCYQIGLSILKSRSRSSFTTKHGHGRLVLSGPQSNINAHSTAIRFACLLKQAQGKAKYASMGRAHPPVCHQIGQSRLKTRSRSIFNTKHEHFRLAPSGPKSLRNAYGTAIRFAWWLKLALGEAKNMSLKLTQHPAFFQIGLSM